MSAILQRAVIRIYIVDDIHKAFWNGGYSRLLRTRAAIAEAWGVHTEGPLTRSSLTVRITIGHDHDHGLSLTRSNQVVEDLGSTSELAPGVLVATSSVQQIEHRILATLVIAGRGIDGHTTLHLQCGAVVPNL